MKVESIDEGLALFALGLLPVEEIPQLSCLFISSGCEVLEIAALALPEPDEHPADLRLRLERAVALAGRTIPGRLSAARDLRQSYALRGSSGTIAPREAARAIIDIFHLVDEDLPKGSFVGESFGISAIVGLYYSYDDVPFDDTEWTQQIDRDLLRELTQLAIAPPSSDDLLVLRERRPTSR